MFKMWFKKHFKIKRYEGLPIKGKKEKEWRPQKIKENFSIKKGQLDKKNGVVLLMMICVSNLCFLFI